MPARLRPADPAAVEAALGSLAAPDAGDADPADLRLLVKHFLAVLSAQAPGNSVEVRVPPYYAVQVIPGVRHTRGTPPAVIELSAETWIALSVGELTWSQAEAAGVLRASGERADLTAYLPLHP
ncbi:MAG: sterol carrier family protein [Nocardioides sp.]